MNRIKLFVVTFVLCVTGVVSAANDHAKHKAHSCPAEKAASCCAEHKHSGEKADKKDDKSESCCQSGASCCKSGESCCAAHKPGEKQADWQESAKHEGGESCCAAGAECCTGGACCAKHKP
ncbi:MAG TPA: hypothetical protein VFS10_07505 [Pyrinomonadaceae bacterium]|nr:hypothetical protein [Pyrinomonadaceae bacterium]